MGCGEELFLSGLRSKEGFRWFRLEVWGFKWLFFHRGLASREGFGFNLSCLNINI